MKAMKILTIAALLLCASGISGGSFPVKTKCNYDVSPYNKPDSLRIKLFDSAMTLQTDSGWGTLFAGSKSIGESLSDGSYGFRFISSTPGNYSYSVWAWKDGELEIDGGKGQIGIDVTSISGDQGVTDSLEKMLDGGRAPLFLTKLDASNSAGPAFNLSGTTYGIYSIATASSGVGIYGGASNTSGMGSYFYGTSIGLLASSGVSGTYGMRIQSASGQGLSIEGAKNGLNVVSTNDTGVNIVGTDQDWGGELDTGNFTPAVSIDFQGSASMTYDGVRNIVWNSNQAAGGYGAGTFGYYLNQRISDVTATVSAADKAEIASKAKDSTWRALRSAYSYATGSFGNYLDASVDAQASPSEVLTQTGSALTSWATSYDPATGTDVFTTGVKVASTANNAITSTSFAPGAITGSAFEINSITASAFSGAAADEIADSMAALSTDTTAILALGQNHPDVFYGAGAGSGGNSVRIYSVDTSGTDAAVSNVTITVRNSSNVFEGLDVTNDSGFATFNLAAGTWKVLAISSLYQWATDKTITLTGAEYDTIMGYNYDAYTPQACTTGCTTTRVYGFLIGPNGDSLVGATVILSMSGDKVRRLDDSAQVFPQSVSYRTKDNPKGYWELDVIPSDNLFTDQNDSVLYSLTYQYGRRSLAYYENLFVPDTNLINIKDLE